MIKVQLRENLRILDDFATDLIFTPNEKKEIPERDLKAYSLKASLYNGDLKLVEGVLFLQIKDAKICLSAKHKDWAYGFECDKYFKKDLNTQELFWIKEAEVLPESLMIIKAGAVEEKVEEKDTFKCDKEGCEITTPHEHERVKELVAEETAE